MIPLRIVFADLARAWRAASPASRVAAGVLVVLGAMALLTPALGYVPGTDVSVSEAGQGPSLAHLLGTDHLGRDVAWRLALATTAFVLPGLLAVSVSTALGVLAGAASGWLGGPVEVVVRWLTGSVASLPRFVWVLLVCAAWGDAAHLLGIAVGLAYAPTVAEVVHARLEDLRADEVLLATRAHGVPAWRRLWVHGVIAGCGRRVARHGVLCFGYFLVVETTLAYIGGFGVAEPWPSWGNMLAFEWGFGWSAVVPGVALWLAAAAVILVADALEEPAHG